MASRKNIPTAEISEVIKGLEGTFEQRMKAFEDRLNQGGPVYNQLTADFQAFKESFYAELDAIKIQINMLMQITDDIEHRSRRKFLLFRGVEDGASENPTQKVIDIISSKLNISNITNNNIKSCFRLGSPSTDKSRPLLVKFNNQSLRSDVWQAKKSLKGSSISISEFLTPRRREIFKQARSTYGIKSCWSHDGNIFLKLPHGEKIKLTSLNQLQELQAKTLSTDIDEASAVKLKSKTKIQRRGMQSK